MRVLLVEDDHGTARSIELMLKSEGFNVFTTDFGEEGVDLARYYDYDLIIHDIDLPDINGVEAVRQIRAAGIQTPIMMITGHSEIEVKTKAFNAGADDYLLKPFHKDELICRSHALVRRSKGHAQSIITVGPIAVNLDEKTVCVGDVFVRLTGKEYQIIELLALRKGSTISKEMFLNDLYGGMDEPELKIIDVFICRVRKKISQASGGQHHINTVWGRGYRMVDDSPADDLSRPRSTALRTAVLETMRGPHRRTANEIADLSDGILHSVRKVIGELHGNGWLEQHGRHPTITWSLTPAGRTELETRTAAVAAE